MNLPKNFIPLNSLIETTRGDYMLFFKASKELTPNEKIVLVVIEEPKDWISSTEIIFFSKLAPPTVNVSLQRLMIRDLIEQRQLTGTWKNKNGKWVKKPKQYRLKQETENSDRTD